MFHLGFIGDFLRMVLDAIYKLVPNYGLTLILFTLLIRLCLMPLDVKSRRSMIRMSKYQPQISALQAKYKNDKEKLNQKTQELYKKEKINPMSGCLPMLLSMPILFAMFSVMRELGNEETVAMVSRIKNMLESEIDFSYYMPKFQNFLWIKNVFQPDSFMSTILPSAINPLSGVTPFGNLTQEMIDSARNFMSTPLYGNWAAQHGNSIIYSAPMLLWKIEIPRAFNGLFILPLLAGGSQFIMSKLNPNMQPQAAAAGDSAAAAQSSGKIMKYFFPLFSVFICATSNAGFALYWVAVNLIQSAQTYLIGKWVERGDKKREILNEEAKNL